jgi:predicted nucleic acid-binding protein
MPKRVIIDAGPVVAYLREAEGKHHVWAVAQFKRFAAFSTCEAVLEEACARLSYYGEDQSQVIDLLLIGAVTTDFEVNRSADRVSRLMKKYADQPMDFADACIVAMSEQVSDCLVVTLDHEDFGVYRRHEREVIPFISPRRS